MDEGNIHGIKGSKPRDFHGLNVTVFREGKMTLDDLSKWSAFFFGQAIRDNEHSLDVDSYLKLIAHQSCPRNRKSLSPHQASP